MRNWRGKDRPIMWEIDGTIYCSVVFSWHLPLAEAFKDASKKKVVIGGPAAKLAGYDMPDLPYPVLPFHNPLATFTTRGCPNGCEFCAVPTLEGDLVELHGWEPRPIVCDNNLLAASRKHFDTVIDRLKAMPYVDFNQGLDAYLFDDYTASRFGELKGVMVRFALDSINDETAVVDAIRCAKNHGLKDIGVYVLIGFEDTPADAQYRLELVKNLGAMPYPMRYQPLTATVKNSYVGEGWTKDLLEDMTRYYFKQNWLGHIPFSEYQYKRHEQEGRLL